MGLLEDGDAVVSAVNQGEVVARLINRGLSPDDANVGWPLRLSLRDRCCRALAQILNAEVMTADRPWKALKGFRFHFIH